MACLVQQRIDGLLDNAEAGERCVVLANNADLNALQRRASKSELVEVAPCAYAREGYWAGLSREDRVRHVVRAMSRQHDSWVFCFSTAALVHGLEVPRPLLRELHVNARGRAGCVRDERLHVHAIRGVRPVEVGGARVTDFWQTVVDCLRTQPFSLALAIADSALRVTGASRDELLRRVRAHGKGRPGYRRAQATASWADGLAENGGESRARAFFIEQGYPVPRIQVELPNPAEPWRTFRVDFYWELPDGRVVIGEFDGAGKYKEREEDSLASAAAGRAVGQVIYERQRESRLTLLGHPVLRFTYDDLLHPKRMERLLASAGIKADLFEDRGVW